MIKKGVSGVCNISTGIVLLLLKKVFLLLQKRRRVKWAKGLQEFYF